MLDMDSDLSVREVWLEGLRQQLHQPGALLPGENARYLDLGMTRVPAWLGNVFLAVLCRCHCQWLYLGSPDDSFL
jgi:hypothetical protein